MGWDAWDREGKGRDRTGQKISRKITTFLLSFSLLSVQLNKVLHLLHQKELNEVRLATISLIINIFMINIQYLPIYLRIRHFEVALQPGNNDADNAPWGRKQKAPFPRTFP